MIRLSAALLALMLLPACVVVSAVDTAASVAVHAAGAAADLTIDAASVAGHAATSVAGAAVDAVKGSKDVPAKP
ncbi:MAG TPA: hypothetical protein VMU33_03875 [Burkholderiaceae bacterium]|nr:hypothetical protein [Burkholderiaceae bacterium]